MKKYSKDDYLYLGSGIALSETITNRVLKELLKPVKNKVYWYSIYIKNNFPIVDFVLFDKFSDIFSEKFNGIDKKAIHIFERKRKRRLNFQEIKYLYILNLIKYELGKRDDDNGLLYQLIYPQNRYYSNMSATGELWLFKTLDNEKEYDKICKVWKCNKNFGGALDKYLKYFFKKMIRKVEIL